MTGKKLHSISLYLVLVLSGSILHTGAYAQTESPGRVSVALARSDSIMMAPGIFAPRRLYPEGRLAFPVLEKLLDSAVTRFTEEDRIASWRSLFSASDRIGIIADVDGVGVEVGTVDAVIDRLVTAGIPPENICVLGGDERDLFNAGFTIRREGRGVRVLGTESEGYRGGVSRVLHDFCTALINVSTLRADPQLTMRGCVANFLSLIPNVERVRRLSNPKEIGSAGAHPAIRQKLRLNILEAYRPFYLTPDKELQRWEFGGILISDDPLAVDMVGLDILQRKMAAEKLPPLSFDTERDYLRAAQEKFRLGQSDLELITILLTEGTTLDEIE